MWLLKDDSGRLIYLKPNETLTVGRNKGDIILTDDGSISRVHARITVQPVENIAEIREKMIPLSTCTISDANSKYGNFILNDDGEETQITEDGYSLRHKDRIRFGLQNYIFTALYVPIVTGTSGMDEEEKNQLKGIIDAIDGRIIYAWTSMCTHMTVNNPIISEKLSCALASCTPVVTMDYWRAVFKAFESNEEFPEIDDYATAVNNQMRNLGTVCVKPNPMRKTCLRNLTFLHFNSKQYTMYKRMIRLAGGTSIKYGEKELDLNVRDDNVIVVQMVESNTTQATGTGDANYAAACEQLSRCKRRAIPECEIALAILNCSTARYCNPTYDYAELFRNRNSQTPEDNSSILALDTQDVEVPTTSGQQQRKTVSHVVAETVEEAGQFEFQAPRSIRRDPVDSTSESVAGSSYSDSVGSMKLASLNHEKYLEEEFNKRSKTSLDQQLQTRSHIVAETVEEASQFEFQAPRSIRRDPVDSTSESVAGSSYSDSVGSMKLASLNHEKYLEEEFNKRSTTSLDQQRQARSRIVKETLEDSDRSESQAFKTVRRVLIDSASESVASSSYNSDSIGSMKLASLNHEKYLEEFNKQTATIGNPMKRDRDEDVAIDSGMKKIRLGVKEEQPRKRSLWDKLQESYAISPTADDDILEEKIDADAVSEMEETKGDKKRASTFAIKDETEEEFDIADNWAVPKSKFVISSHRARVTESDEKMSCATDDDGTSRKRKVGRSDASPSREAIENPRKRNRFSLDNVKEMIESAREDESKKKSVTAARGRLPKVESDEGVWNRTKNYRLGDDFDCSSNSRNKYKCGENESNRYLLRITCTDEPDDTAGSELRKCFRKRHTTIPQRIDFYDVSDDPIWTSGTDKKKNTSFDHEDVAETHKFSPNTDFRKKTLRV